MFVVNWWKLLRPSWFSAFLASVSWQKGLFAVVKQHNWHIGLRDSATKKHAFAIISVSGISTYALLPVGLQWRFLFSVNLYVFKR